MALEVELRTYERMRAALMREHQGRFAVVAGEELIGVYVTAEEALDAGYDRVGLSPFLVKRIQAVEPVLNLAFR